jgi:hypothetical protein
MSAILKNIIYLLVALPLLIPGCSKEKVTILPKATLVKNENILAKTLLHTEWSTVPAIMSMPYADLRNSLISDIKDKCNDPLTSLQSMSDYDLSWGALMYKFLFDAGIRSAHQLLALSLDDYRNTIIDLNAPKTSLTVSQLQAKSNARNLNIAYNWWFYQNSSTKLKIDKFNNIATSHPSFDKKDNRGVVMDILRIVKADEVYTYLGVYHAMVSDGHFKLYLAGSNDLSAWTYITELGDRAHQGDIEKWGTGYLVANEQYPTQGSNNIQIRY